MSRFLPDRGRVAIAVAALLAIPTATLGQQTPPEIPQPAPSYEQLIERLQAAEQRISDLEGGPNPSAQANGDMDSVPTRPGRTTLSDSPSATDPDNGEELRHPYESAASPPDSPAADSGERLSALEDIVLAPGKPTFKIGGRIHFDHWAFLEDSEGIHFFEHPDRNDPSFGTDPEDRFVFRRIRLEMQGTVPDLMIWRMQVDFNNPGTPEYKDVYLGWNLPYNHTLTIGNQKRPIGLDHLNSSRFNVFAERPLAVETFNEDARRIGLLMTSYTDDLRYNWQYGAFNLENTSTTGRYIGDSLQFGGYGRLATTPWYDEASDGRGYLHLAIAGSVARPDGDASASDSNRNEARFRTRPAARSDSRWVDTGRIRGAELFEQMGLETVLNVGAVQVVGEYLTTWVQRDSMTQGTGPNTFFHGGYVYASYFLTGEYMPWNRENGTLERVYPHENFFLIDRCTGGIGSGWGAWQLKARYDHLDLSDADIRGGVENNVTFGLNWWWNPYARLQFDVTRGLIDQHREVGGFESGDFWHAGTRFAIDF